MPVRMQASRSFFRRCIRILSFCRRSSYCAASMLRIRHPADLHKYNVVRMRECSEDGTAARQAVAWLRIDVPGCFYQHRCCHQFCSCPLFITSPVTTADHQLTSDPISTSLEFVKIYLTCDYAHEKYNGRTLLRSFSSDMQRADVFSALSGHSSHDCNWSGLLALELFCGFFLLMSEQR